MQRKDLNPIEVATGYFLLTQPPHSKSHRDVAQSLGMKDHTAVTNHLALLELPQELQELVARATTTEAHARQILKISDKTLQIQVEQ